MDSKLSKRKLSELYVAKILEKNNYVNLTSLKNFDDALIQHIDDSIKNLYILNDAPDGIYGDLGSGGGFPGVPLAIYSNRETYIFDSINKKMNIVNSVCKDLKIDNITTIPLRIEDASMKYKSKFAVLTARGLSNMSSIMELATPLLRRNGVLICLKSILQDEEFSAACKSSKLLGLELKTIFSYTLQNGIKRKSFVWKKTKDSEIKLPRKTGLAQKRPLGY